MSETAICSLVDVNCHQTKAPSKINGKVKSWTKVKDILEKLLLEGLQRMVHINQALI